jgi:N-acetylglucosaminyldiphosphoundecaprenol N-acetyl-beta-D-mannosaminyltransferase
VKTLSTVLKEDIRVDLDATKDNLQETLDQNLLTSLDFSVEDDFSRDVWCLFGLPVDNLTMESTSKLLESRINSDRINVLSTINVNWVISALEKPNFRAAILDSDICTLDGKPLLWLAYALRFPMRELVPGSSLIAYLQKVRNTQSPFSIFLFGGDQGIAFQARKKINQKLGGLHAVGHFDPGFGSLKELNTGKSVQVINAKSPNILLVALGAYKGQLWIEENKNKLKANIISHLGATINFLAETEARAPRFMQVFGIEWMWRIIQKPSLWHRYAMDAIVFLRLIAFHFMPYWISSRNLPSKGYEKKSSITISETDQELVIKLQGIFTYHQRDSVKKFFKDAVYRKKQVILDFQGVELVDNSFLGLLLLLLKHQHRNKSSLQIKNLNKKLENIFQHNFIDKSFAALQHKT